MEGRDSLVQGLIRRIGDGETTHIWTQNWIPREHNMPPLACLSVVPPQLVNELLVQHSASCDQAKLQEVFIAKDVEAILSITLSTKKLDNFLPMES